jgi:hypothetical protein
MKALTKADSIRRHACRRAKERFGLTLTDELHDELVSGFKKKRGPDRRISCRIWIFRVKHEGRDMQVVYDRKRELIISFLKVK